jgi:hypothetical protein
MDKTQIPIAILQLNVNPNAQQTTQTMPLVIKNDNAIKPITKTAMPI